MENTKKQSLPVAVVTGGAGGIGAAVSEALALAGYFTVVLYHSGKNRALSLCDTLRAKGCACTSLFADVAEEASVQNAVGQILEQHKKIDLLVNCAGIAQNGLLTDRTCAQWQHLMQINFGGVLHTTHAVYPAMVHQKSGVIINIGSIWGESGASCEAVYSASKGAVIAFSRAMAAELAPSGIRVLCVCPGVIDTPMLDCYTDEEKQALAAATPLGRLGTPQDVADAVLYLARASFLTGTVLRVDGGLLPFGI